MLKTAIARAIASAKRGSLSAVRCHRSHFSSSSHHATPAGQELREVTPFLKQLNNEFVHGDGVFFSAAAVGIISATLIFEQWVTANKKPEDIYAPKKLSFDHLHVNKAVPIIDSSHEGEAHHLGEAVEISDEVESASVDSEVTDSDAASLEVVEDEQISAAVSEEIPEPIIEALPEPVESDNNVSAVASIVTPPVEEEEPQHAEEVAEVRKEADAENENALNSQVTEVELAAAATPSDVQEVAPSEDLDECPFCVFMKGGPCKNEFIAWQDCVDAVREKEGDMAELCLEQTYHLKNCMDANTDYYAVALQGIEEDQDKPQAAEENEEVQPVEESSAVVPAESPDVPEAATEAIPIIFESPELQEFPPSAPAAEAASEQSSEIEQEEKATE